MNADRIENEASDNSSTVACVFVVVTMFLPSRCLGPIGVYTYIQTDRHTDCFVRYMKWAVKMLSGAMICVHTKFHKDWFSYSKLIGDIHRQTDSMVMA
jgi:hypothetical protein